ncbi:hypothetical protein ANN_00422 [Periplaneta americana]|uniref:Phosphoenolpyruvate synthase n=1 Tax=Periplaneta americana TaxID=6978 RepID=A0ABQ8TT50_PERAM|nr:hypothetical protein ANN_00422 [Periplaneta americana]
MLSLEQRLIGVLLYFLFLKVLIVMPSTDAMFCSSSAVFGHVYKPDGCHSSIDSCDISLPNLGNHPKWIPQNTMLRFSAGGNNYTAGIHTIPDSTATVYGGRPWDYEAHLSVFRCIVNSKQGAGTAAFWYRYFGACPDFPSTSLPILKEPTLRSDAEVPFVIDFKDRQCGNSALVGGKGSSLGLMASLEEGKLSAVIPPGFCLTVAALEKQMLEFSQLQEAVTTLQLVSSMATVLGDIQEQCNRTVTLFESTAVTETVTSEVSDHLQRLLDSTTEPQLLAVRSSAVGEDSEDMSAAGQNATLLGVRCELMDVLEAIQHCWASLYTFQSLQYRRQHGQPLQVGMGVVVQLMVPADTAGVLFTWHPTTGNPQHMLITANYGLGESVVSAQVEPDTILLIRDEEGQLFMKEGRCGNKAHMVTLSDQGGVTAEPLDREKVSQLCLTNDDALLIGQLGLQVEQVFGGPRDIEWAISKGQMYLLQARPITSLDSWSDFELLHELDTPILTDSEVLTTANVGEVFPGAITPLSQSITTRSSDLAPRHGLPYRPGYHYSSNVVTSSYHGMINVLNTMLRSVGSTITLGDKVVDLAVYGHLVTTPELLELAIERNGALSSFGRFCLVLKIMKDMILKGRVVQRAEKLTLQFVLEPRYYRYAKSLYSSISNSLHLLAEVAECHGDTSRIGLFTQVLTISVLTEGNEELTPDHYSDVALLLSSCSDVISAEIPAALEDLASSIDVTGKMVEFCKVPPSQAIQWLEKNCPKVFVKLNKFLLLHGHRSIKEFELMTETWGMKPEILIKTLQTMLQNSVTSRVHKSTKKTLKDEELLSQLKTVKKWGTRMALSWLLSMCRSTVTGRESNKDCYITITHKLRMAYRQLAYLMAKEGRIPDSQLLFFFTHYELGVLLRTRNPSLISKAIRRRRLFPQWEQLVFPEIIRGVPAPMSTESLTSSRRPGALGVRLVGTSVCSGTVLGRAFVVTDLDQIGSLKAGDILITHSTDVGWSPYFPLLGGIVTELGGLISHDSDVWYSFFSFSTGAVVAREYGLPCIVGCQNATRILNTGRSECS